MDDSSRISEGPRATALKVLFITGYAENAAMGIGGLTREWLSCQNRLQWTGWQRALGNFYFASPSYS